MMKEIKNGFKLMRYAYGIKWAIVFSVIFILLGVSLQLVPIDMLWVFGGYMLLITAMFPTQLIYTLSVSNMVQGSSFKKNMQTLVPTAVNLMITLLLYFIYILMNGIRVLNNYETKADVSNSIIWLSMLVFVILIYNAITYKYYIVSTFIMFILVYGGMKMATWQSMKKLFTFKNLGFIQATLIGAGILIIGGVLEYIASLLVYKAPIAKMSQNASLRKYM